MSSEIICQVLGKLIGKVNPVGESNIDEIRLGNLETMCEVTEYLLNEIESISIGYSDRIEYSMSKSGQYAKKFLINK